MSWRNEDGLPWGLNRGLKQNSENNIPCPICGKTFKTRGSLATHKYNFHKDGNDVIHKQLQPMFTDPMQLLDLQMETNRSQWWRRTISCNCMRKKMVMGSMLIGVPIRIDIMIFSSHLEVIGSAARLQEVALLVWSTYMTLYAHGVWRSKYGWIELPGWVKIKSVSHFLWLIALSFLSMKYSVLCSINTTHMFR